MNNIKRFRKDMILLFAAELLWALGLAMYTSFFPIHIKEVGGNDIIVGFIMSIPSFLGVLAIAGGIWSDLAGSKNAIVFGWAITIPAPLIWMFADSWQWMLVGQIFYALTWVCAPAIAIYILNYDTTGNKMAGYAFVFSAGPIGSIIAPAVGGEVITSFGKETLYFLVFVLYSLATVCTLLLSRQAAKAKPEKRVEYHHADFLTKNSIPKLFDAINPLKQMSSMIIILTIIVSAQNIGQAFVTLYAEEVWNFSLEYIGVASTVLHIGSAIFNFLLGISEKKVKPYTVLIAGNIVFFVSTLFVILGSSTIFSLVSAFFFRGIGRSILLFSQAILAKNITDENNKGFILSVYIAIRNIAIGLVTYPGAFLYHVNPAYPFYAEAIITVLWIVIIACSSRFKGQLSKHTVSF
ncbi:MAG: MFS transporter [Clostridiaceae bacterium]|nr:MFS transporter [Clostridiaceae bacterium]